MIREQTQRLLKDPKSGGLAHNFSRQWLGLDALGTTIKPDAARFPDFDVELTLAMRDEADMLFDYVLREDRSLLELIDADYTFVNAQLARHYGLVGVSGGEMRRVPLTDHNRGGVLTLGSVLTITSYPLRTSPVLRGRWVLEQLLGGKIPPPPPNVPLLPREESQAGQLTPPAAARATSRRRRLCRLPRADGSARLRPGEFWPDRPLADQLSRGAATGAINPDGPPVDASGALPSGEKFAGPAELKALILARKDEFLRHFVRKMFGYALGRELNKADDCAVAATLKALGENQYRSSVLVDMVVQSYPFQHRFREP